MKFLIFLLSYLLVSRWSVAWLFRSELCSMEFYCFGPEMVACVEMYACNTMSGDNEKLSCKADDHRLCERCKKKWPPLSVKNVATVQERFNRSPQKSTLSAARESGLTRHTIRTVLHKELNLRPWKTHYVQDLKSEDCDRRSPELQEGQISPHVVFTCRVTQKRCTRENLKHWRTWRVGPRRSSMISQTMPFRRLSIQSLAVWGNWLTPPLLTLKYEDLLLFSDIIKNMYHLFQ